LVVIFEVLFDRRAERFDAAEGAATNAFLVISAKKRSTWFSHDELVGMKWT